MDSYMENQDIKLKPMKCELNYLSKSDGSALLAQGKVCLCIFTPILSCDK